MKHLTRIRIDLSHDWLFLKRRLGRRWLCTKTGRGEIVDLPHCWNAKDAFQDNVSYYRGYGSYRKQFTLPDHARDADTVFWRLESEGFYGTGDIWLNRHRLAKIDGQYLGFSLETGEHLRLNSENILGIRLTNRCRSHVLPGIKMPDFLLYGGLSGRVRLEGVPLLHLDRKKTQIHCENVTGEESKVLISFGLANRSEQSRRCTAQWSVMDADGNKVSEAEPVCVGLEAGRDSGELTTTLDVPGPGLWSPDSPRLYRAQCRILENDRVWDCTEERFGFREPVFEPGKGFFLNGKRLELRGCNRHESMPGFGRALPEILHREDAELIKKLGFNFVRLSHYPQHPCFLDACDQLGLMVYAEIATWKSVRRGRWLESACRQMRDMIARDRNRPCIIIWGMGNESRSRQAYLKLRDVARELDPFRPVTYAENHFRRALREKTTEIPDVWGANYEMDALDDGRDASRLKSVIMSECANYPHAVRGDPVSETAQVAAIEDALAGIEDKPYVSGFALWCFNDYATLRKKRYKRHSGIVDAWRVPKIASALIQARYVQEPFVRIFGDWGKDGGKAEGGRWKVEGGARTVSREIHVFTNCDRVILLRNCKELCSIEGATHLVRNVDFEPGELLAIGTRKDGRATDRLLSYTAARQIEVRPDRPEASAARRETVGIFIRILDERRNPVTSWQGNLKTEVTGPAVLRSYCDDLIPVFAGIGRTFITSRGEAGVVSIKASHDLLESGEASVRFLVPNLLE